ncbi:hypothetical protein C1701_04815 [Actinoalloteichus sp. AHMU CJ021]|uniref:LytR cell envelope-related transcriptional attenuator n=1 Tax=Actinoalloteichus caeruleus DSM 43889 TaxID=1120930 RepID=A0ABT1JHI0_ACTCY|nr:hypothetical protein C1701_04815 [Actinoalloteichus sp. AHMU CJ021]MCP2331744.1 LytR cell envelope-related transcriptional attenuator [Actinoalloteichus caeruleus DSM 43889]
MGARKGTPQNTVPRYRRRKPLPALILIAVLGGVAGWVWTGVFDNIETIEEATRCSPPSVRTTAPDEEPPPEPGEAMPRDALDRTDPAPPSQVMVTVLNANGVRGQATMIAEELSALEFEQAYRPNNDPVYADQDMDCHGQIRFGPNSAAMARTLSLAVPCAELVSDQRQEATIALALGSKFDEVKPNAAAKEILEQLAAWGTDQPSQQGGQQSDGGDTAGPALDEEMLAAARDVSC